MTTPADVAVLGDLMLECIVHDAPGPAENTTLVVDSPGQTVGGAAFNTCWNLVQLGRPPRLVAPFGRRQAAAVIAGVSAANLTEGGLIEADGDTDLLVVLAHAGAFRGVYLRGPLPGRLAEAVRTRVAQPRCLVIVGSRHPALRQVALQVAQAFAGDLLVFSPAYAIYEYGADDLRPLVRRADLTIVNEYEAEYLRRTLGATSVDDVAASSAGITIVTQAHRGARVFEGARVRDYASRARTTADVFGAGDAFLAGFLVEKLRGSDTDAAARLASLCGAHVADAGGVRVAFDEATIRRNPLARTG